VIVRTDIRDRALPWTALMAHTRHLPNDLNLDWGSRRSALSVYVLWSLLVLGWWRGSAWLFAALPVVVLLACNRYLYVFFLRERALWFLLRVISVHWLYFTYSALVFAGGVLVAGLVRRRAGETHGYPAAVGNQERVVRIG
jgi:hypothetical protein